MGERDLYDRDKLVLRGLQFHGFHGVRQEEKTLGQKFLVDVDAWLDLSTAGMTDSITDTVSYTDIYKVAKEIVEGPSQNLLESAAHLIANTTLLKFPQIHAIKVKVDSRFTQQELPACKPILTPQWVISVFTLVGIIFIPIGVAALLASNDVVEIIDRYETACVPPNMTNDKVGYIQNPAISKTCTRVLKVPKDMDKPIYVYYQLDNFYQNHRRYVKSRNDQQLRDASKVNETSGCDPEKTTADGTPIVPCGLIAWSLFNDTYSFAHGDGQALTLNKKDISWKSDRNHKFGSDVYPKNFQNGGLIGGGKLNPKKPLSEQENLIVWMRTAALPTFRKLYGRIEVDLKENDTITVVLENNYNTYSFGGKKKLVLSTTTWLGGKNDFLGIAYISIGGLCFFLATAFTVVYLVKPRKLGDPSYLSWNRSPGIQ